MNTSSVKFTKNRVKNNKRISAVVQIAFWKKAEVGKGSIELHFLALLASRK